MLTVGLDWMASYICDLKICDSKVVQSYKLAQYYLVLKLVIWVKFINFNNLALIPQRKS